MWTICQFDIEGVFIHRCEHILFSQIWAITLKCIGLYIFSLKIPDFLLILLFRILHQNNSVEVGFAVRIGFSPTKPAPLLRAPFYSMEPVLGREGRQYFSYMAEAALPAVNKQWKLSKHCQDCCNSLTITALRDLWLKASADLTSANCLRFFFCLFFGGGERGKGKAEEGNTVLH